MAEFSDGRRAAAVCRRSELSANRRPNKQGYWSVSGEPHGRGTPRRRAVARRATLQAAQAAQHQVGAGERHQAENDEPESGRCNAVLHLEPDLLAHQSRGYQQQR
jgi:hypothetical protein